MDLRADFATYNIYASFVIICRSSMYNVYISGGSYVFILYTNNYSYIKGIVCDYIAIYSTR